MTMPWKEAMIMEQKIESICEWRTGKHTISELCRCFGISRPTAYKIIARFEKEGYEGLKEMSRKPRGLHPNATQETVVNSILELKEKHKLWGAKKIWKLLYNDYPDEAIPTILTVHNILKNACGGSSQSTPFLTQNSAMRYGLQITKGSS